jgi:hypothetical protein
LEGHHPGSLVTHARERDPYASDRGQPPAVANGEESPQLHNTPEESGSRASEMLPGAVPDHILRNCVGASDDNGPGPKTGAGTQKGPGLKTGALWRDAWV